MRLRLHIELEHNDRGIIPVNYQYAVSSWIYSRLAVADPEFSSWLHEQGYRDGFRSFKLFTFSNIQIQGKLFDDDRLILAEKNGFLEISFLVEEAMGIFISGLFNDAAFRIGDAKSSAGFVVRSVECLKNPDFLETMHYTTLSPIVVSRFDETRGQPAYLSPDQPGYGELFFNNLIHKFSVAKGAQNTIDDNLMPQMGNFRLLSEPHSRLITIKAGQAKESKIRGFMFDFSLTAPVSLHRTGYFAGFGEKNSMGFGCVRVKNNIS